MPPCCSNAASPSGTGRVCGDRAVNTPLPLPPSRVTDDLDAAGSPSFPLHPGYTSSSPPLTPHLRAPLPFLTHVLSKNVSAPVHVLMLTDLPKAAPAQTLHEDGRGHPDAMVQTHSLGTRARRSALTPLPSPGVLPTCEGHSVLPSAQQDPGVSLDHPLPYPRPGNCQHC